MRLLPSLLDDVKLVIRFRGRAACGWSGLFWLIFAEAACIWAQPLSFSRKEIPVGPDCCIILWGDFNRDGKPDMVVNYADSYQTVAVAKRRILVLLGNGDGSFTPMPVSGNYQSPVLIAAVDVNADNKLDLVAVDNSNVIVLRGNGDGSFQSPTVVASGSIAAVGDFNGDGKPDLLSATFMDELQVRLGKGDGTFGSPIQSTLPANLPISAIGFLRVPVLADFNRDGKLDLAFTTAVHGQQGKVFVGLGNGDGTFRMLEPDNHFENTGVSGPLVAGDFNGDGIPDLCVQANIPGPSLNSSTAVSVLLGNGDGTFRPSLPAPGVGSSLAVADFNQDGKLDLVIDSSVLLGNGDGTFQPQRFFGNGQVSVGSLRFAGVAVADFNLDGNPDVVTVSHFTGFFDQQPGSILSNFVSSGLSVLLNDSPGPEHSLIGLSAASGEDILAPESLASVVGVNLASTTVTPNPAESLTSAGGIAVHVRDAVGVDRLARLLYVSPSQINFEVPAGTADGLAILNVDTGTLPLLEGTHATRIQAIAPAIFTADGTGKGAPAASAIRVPPNGPPESVRVFDCSTSGCAPAPIDLSDGSPVFLTLYGTGFRHADDYSSGVPNASPSARIGSGCRIGDLLAITTYVGPGDFGRLDQMNIRLPPLRNVGETDLICQFIYQGRAVSANIVRINIK